MGQGMELYDPSDGPDPTPEELARTQRNPTPAPGLPAALFQLGQLVITPGAIATLIRLHINLTQLIVRHVTGDWGDLPEEAKLENDLAVQEGNRILSCYGDVFNPDRLWLLTEPDRSATTVMRADGY